MRGNVRGKLLALLLCSLAVCACGSPSNTHAHLRPNTNAVRTRERVRLWVPPRTRSHVPLVPLAAVLRAAVLSAVLAQVTRDYTTSHVRFPPSSFDDHAFHGQGPDAKMKQSVCLSLELEPSFLRANAEFGQNPTLFGAKLPTM